MVEYRRWRAARERLKRVEAEFPRAGRRRRGSGGGGAQLRGQAEALRVQHVELMQALKDREGKRPKGGKKSP